MVDRVLAEWGSIDMLVNNATFTVFVAFNDVAPNGMLTRWVPNRTQADIQRTIERNPLRRYSELEDVAAAIIAVARNDSMTGEVVVVDAGASLVR